MRVPIIDAQGITGDYLDVGAEAAEEVWSLASETMEYLTFQQVESLGYDPNDPEFFQKRLYALRDGRYCLCYWRDVVPDLVWSGDFAYVSPNRQWVAECMSAKRAEAIVRESWHTPPDQLVRSAARERYSPPPSANKREGEMPALSERKYLILQTLLELGATSADTRRTTAEIAEKAEGKAAEPKQFKQPIAELKRDGLLDTKEGRGGGCWLTASGKLSAEDL